MVDEFLYLQVESARFDEIINGTRREYVCRGTIELELHQRITLVRCDQERKGLQQSLEVIVLHAERIMGQVAMMPPAYSRDDHELFGIIQFTFELEQPVLQSIPPSKGHRIVLGGL